MEKVSSEFKNAINSDIRYLKGYVEVIYDNASKNKISIAEVPDTIQYSLASEMIDDRRKIINYATLENEYTLLDGTFMLPNRNIIGNSAGFVSNLIFENSDKIITLNLESVKSSGITIYFKDNIALKFKIVINDNIIINAENKKSTYQYIFEKEIIVNKFKLEITQMEYSDRRIRIPEIDFGLTQIYEDNELIDFQVEEELDLFAESLPINTCSVNISNYPDENGNKFDPINPKGIVKYLTENVILKPYIGILTSKGVEYVKMGMFYLDDWNANENVTLNASGVLKKLKEKSIKADNDFFGLQNIKSLSKIIKNTSNVETKFPDYSNNWNNSFLQNTDLFQYLQNILPNLLYFDNFTTPYQEYRKFYENRNNELVINEISNKSVTKISRYELLEDVKYETRKQLGILNIKQPSYGIYSNYRSANVISEIYVLIKDVEYVWFTTNQFITSINGLTCTVLNGNAKAELIGNTNNMIYVKVSGTPNSSINIVCNATIADVNSVEKEISIINNKDGSTVNLDFTNYFIINNSMLEKFFFGIDKKYFVSAKTIGDPSIELGDVVSIQTKYDNNNDGYKDIIITKMKFSFDGGLSCDLEGVGS